MAKMKFITDDSKRSDNPCRRCYREATSDITISLQLPLLSLGILLKFIESVVMNRYGNGVTCAILKPPVTYIP
jgi:hypothetical protein